ncbi:MAG: PDZ domain-containing protein [SAR324 cluster bacterium]|nr:PDZ domain-containing protein [SAR324 cluster bacterium]
MNNIKEYLVPIGFVVFFMVLLHNLSGFSFNQKDSQAAGDSMSRSPAGNNTVQINLVNEPENRQVNPLVPMNKSASLNFIADRGLNTTATKTMRENPGNFVENTEVKTPFVDVNIQLSEGHWQGMEVIPLSKELKKKLRISPNIEGVMVDEVTLNSLVSGGRGGDILIAVDNKRVRSIEDVVSVSKFVRNRNRVGMTVIRNNRVRDFVLMTNGGPLGFSQAETAPMITPGDVMPHPYRGACTGCHPIGTIANLEPDPDLIILPPPPIRVGAIRPHRDHGPCFACHVIQ